LSCGSLQPPSLIPLIPVHFGCDSTQGAVGSVIIVLVDPVIQDQAGLANCPELPLVQAVVSEDAIEALIVAVLPGLTRLDILGVDSLFFAHPLDRVRGQYFPHPTSTGHTPCGSPSGVVHRRARRHCLHRGLPACLAEHSAWYCDSASAPGMHGARSPGTYFPGRERRMSCRMWLPFF